MSTTDTLGEVIARAGNAERFAAWQRQAAGTGWCSRPVRLAGGQHTVDPATGDVLHTLDSSVMPDGVLLIACGNRRASRCPTCSRTYRDDSWQLVAAGLRGGKGVPASVAEHPQLFITATAPSCGPVHAHCQRGHRLLRCRPRGAKRCPHGQRIGCNTRHRADDPACGQPICARCYDYEGAVLFNALVGKLWRQTTINLRRACARRLGWSEREFRDRARLSYVKVAEFQRRGLVHLHIAVRADGADADQVAAPPAELTAQVVADAARVAFAATTVAIDVPDGEQTRRRIISWGDQLDVAVLRNRDGRTPNSVAGYIAKYATKSTEAVGGLDLRLTADDLPNLAVDAHVRKHVETCWRLGGLPGLAALNLRRYAHALGFGGHFSSRSRRYSTTLGALRAARAAWRRRRCPQTRPPSSVTVGDWRYAGVGWRNNGDAWLVETGRRLAELGRDELRRQRQALNALGIDLSAAA